MYIEGAHRFLGKVRLKDVSKGYAEGFDKVIRFLWRSTQWPFGNVTNINRYFAKWYLSEDANGYIAPCQ